MHCSGLGCICQVGVLCEDREESGHGALVISGEMKKRVLVVSEAGSNHMQGGEAV